ncbi:MAG TPA: hypothetical protein PLB63_06300 [Planctomycetota bacterium]|nr:hypothetical protein [Planctomycetota bacterium]HQB01319.1 hypothetical protein [Planctomycetota bacterium]
MVSGNIYGSKNHGQGNFWEFVDPFMSSRGELETFCQSLGLVLKERIGSGGFGSVYLVEDILSGEKFALKLMDFVSHVDNVLARTWKRGDNVFCDVSVNICQTIEDVFQSEFVGCGLEALIPFLVVSEIEDDVWIERIQYHHLVRTICKEDMLWKVDNLPESFLPGMGENFLWEVLDEVKWKSLCLKEVGNLAPSLFCEHYYTIEEESLICHTALDALCFFSLNISFKDLCKQVRRFLGEYGQGFLRELFVDLKNKHNLYWRFECLPHHLDSCNAIFENQIIDVLDVLRRYSLEEVLQRFPCFFQLSIHRNFSGGATLPFLKGDVLIEVKRLLAVKQEIMVANSLRTSYPGINHIVGGIYCFHDNICFFSPFLYDVVKMFPANCFHTFSSILDGEEEKSVVVAFPIGISFLYSMVHVLLHSIWDFGDIKWSNFKIDLAGEWRMIDFGGHGLRAMDAKYRESIVGSNDYANYALFYLLNVGEVEPDVLSYACGINGQLFSMIKVIVRMLSGRSVDRLRGTDLNRALLQNFQGYHERIFFDFLDVLLYQKDSDYYFQSFHLSNDDVEFLFGENNLGVEVAFRRFSFLIGLCLTGYCAVSVLDEEMQSKIVVHLGKKIIGNSSWQVILKEDTIILEEDKSESYLAIKRGISPEVCLTLMDVFFPNLQTWFAQEQENVQIRRQILHNLNILGVHDVSQYFSPLEIRYFATNVRKCLEKVATFVWLDKECMDYICKDQVYILEKWEHVSTKLTHVLSESIEDITILNDVISLLVDLRNRVWNYVLGIENESNNSLISTELFFLSRYFMLYTAKKYHWKDVLDFACQVGWLSSTDSQEIKNILQQSKMTSIETRIGTVIQQELSRMFLHKDICQKQTWEAYYHEAEKNICLHPFYDLIGDTFISVNTVFQTLENVEFNWKHFLKTSEKDQWHHIETLASCSSKFPWAELALLQNALDIFQTAMQRCVDSCNEKCVSIQFPCILDASSWKSCNDSMEEMLEQLSHSGFFLEHFDSETAEQINGESPEHFDSETAAQVNDTSPEQVEGETAAQVNDTSPEQVDSETAEQVNDTAPEQVDSETAEQVNDTASEQVEGETAAQVNDTSPEQVEGETAAQVNDTSPEQVDGESSEHVENHYEQHSSHLGNYIVLPNKDSSLYVKLSWLYRMMTTLEKQAQYLYQLIGCHYFFATIEEEQNPLEYLFQKMSTFSRIIPKNSSILLLMRQIQAQEEYISKFSFGQKLLQYVSVYNILDKVDNICKKYYGYLNVSESAFVTMRKKIDLQSLEFQSTPLFNKEDLDIDNVWKKDYLYMRILRFISKEKNMPISLGVEERKALGLLMSCFYENGLLLSNDFLQENQIAIQIYKDLQFYTRQFQEIPSVLSDLKNIGYANIQKLTPSSLDQRFVNIFPLEVLSPSFRGSVLVEFLNYQIEISQTKQEMNQGMRRRILLMQVENEVRRLEEKYREVKNLYPSYVKMMDNLMLLSSVSNIETLGKQVIESWNEKIKLFQDYLNIARWILQEEEQENIWSWSKFFEQKNTFLHCVYPELQKESDLFLSFFALEPLPNFSEIRSLLQKCRNVNISEEKQNQLLAILQERKSDTFKNAKKFVDDFCLTESEEKINQALCNQSHQNFQTKEWTNLYWQARKSLPFSLRTLPETEFIEQIIVAKDSRELSNIVLLELWKCRFQKSINISIVQYAYNELATFSKEQKDKIVEMFQNSLHSAKPSTLFQWLFSNYIFEPSILLLNSFSLFEGKRSEEIRRCLALKYQLEEPPLELQYNLIKTLKEQLLLKIPKQKIYETLKQKILEGNV